MQLRSSLLLLLGIIFTVFWHVDAQKKVSVSSVQLDSAVDDVQWAGKKHETVFVKTIGGRLYRSQDSGRTWNNIIETLTKHIPSHLKKEDLVIDAIRVNNVDRSVVLISSTKHHHFITDDAGEKWRYIKQPMPIHSWIWHPTRRNYALLSMWTEGCVDDVTPPEDKPCSHDLFYTEDLGMSFRPVQTYVVQFSWGDKSTQSEDKIFYTHHRVKELDQPRYGGWSKTVDFSMMSVTSRHSTVLVQQGNKFLVSNGYIFVARLTNAVNQAVDLFVSTDGGKTFEDSILPFELIERSYTILDTSGDAVVLHVNHGEESKAGTGNIYVSDKEGLRFALSLPNNIRSTSGECEFDKVASMDGVYIANYRDMSSSSSAVAAGKDDEKNAKKTRNKSNKIIRTTITFDKGASWQHLTPPAIDSLGQPVLCSGLPGAAVNEKGDQENCWLHLHGVTNFHNYAPFYSVENAVGLIMGTGNVGPHLRHEPEVTNTYLSRDGGLTWSEVHKGAFIYEFGDHGSLVVMADDLRKTSQVVFSWNEGESWYDIDLDATNPIDVDNIAVEPDAKSVQFLLYGTRGETGILYHIDFTALEQPACKGVYAPGSVSSDYETWSPSNRQGVREEEKCLLGRHTVFTRRKKTAECFNGQNFERPTKVSNCQCTMADYECDFGFSRAIGSLECKPDNLKLFEKEYCGTDGFKVVKGYRKVPGDTCEGGVVPPMIRIPCENRALGFLGWVLRIVFYSAIIGGLYFAFFIHKNGEYAVIVQNSVTQAKDTVLKSFSGNNNNNNGKKTSYTILTPEADSIGKSANVFRLDDDEFESGTSGVHTNLGGNVETADFYDDDDTPARTAKSLDDFGTSSLASRVGRTSSPSRNNSTVNNAELPKLNPPPKFVGSTLLDDNFD